MTQYSECYYVPGSLHIVDVINPSTGLTQFGKKDAAEVAAEAPNAVRMSFDVALEQIDAAQTAAFVKPVSEIREADYWYALEVLPPVGWKSSRGVESFKMSERLCGNITSIFAQCGKRWFTLTDRCTLSADEIADRVGAYIKQNPVAAPAEHFKL